jgi:hypothetical protein
MISPPVSLLIAIAKIFDEDFAENLRNDRDPDDDRRASEKYFHKKIHSFTPPFSLPGSRRMGLQGFLLLEVAGFAARKRRVEDDAEDERHGQCDVRNRNAA